MLRVMMKASIMSMAQYAELNAAETSAFMGLDSYLSKTTIREIKYQREAVKIVVMLY